MAITHKIPTLTLVIFFSTFALLTLPMTKADTNQPLIFSSGLTLYSPVNTTYSTNIIEFNGTFNCPKAFASSLNYSIDGKYQDGFPWSLDANSIIIPQYYTVDGSFQLPQLPDGSHQLSIGIVETHHNSKGALINRTTWVNTVYFTIASSKPTPTLTPTTTPTNTPTSNPNVPEFPTLMILPFFAAVILLSIVFIRKRMPKKSSFFVTRSI